ncbi:MAG: peptidylprolyl isomerase [Kiritimatiellia bacterium]
MALRVNGIEVSADAVEREIARLEPDYKHYITENGGEPDAVQLREWATENLVEKEVLRQEAMRSQTDPDEKKVAAWLEENQAVLGDELSDEERRARCVEDIKIRTLVKSIRKSVQRPSEAELQCAYDSNPERFTVPESLKVSHICRVPHPGADKARNFIDLLDLKKRMESLEIEWMDALQLSDTFQRDYGMFDTVMRGMLPAEIEEKLFSLELEQITDVIELESGTLHLFKILVKKEPELIPFAAVCEELSSLMFAEAAESKLNEMLDALKAQAVIIYD